MNNIEKVDLLRSRIEDYIREDRTRYVPLGEKVVTISLFGKRGSGKTLFMTLMAFLDWIMGADVYLNYAVKFDSTYIEKSNFYEKINKDTRRKFVGLDDMCNSAQRSIHEWELQRLQNLIRKLVGERVTIMFSTPIIEQYSPTIRGFTDIFISTRCFGRSRYGIPEKLKVWGYYTLEDAKRDDCFFCKVFDLKKHDITSLFSTSDVPKPFTSGVYETLWLELNKWAYSSEKGIILKLTEIIKNKGISASQSKDYAKLIHAGYDPFSPEDNNNPQRTLKAN